MPISALFHSSIITCYHVSHSHSQQNAGLDEAQAGIKIAGRNISNPRYTDDTILRAERETREPLDESERAE